MSIGQVVGMKQGIVYILRSLKTGRFYIGSTNDLARRLNEHKNCRSKYTSETGPYQLIFNQTYETLSSARKIERWLKAQKSSKFIERIIQEGNIEKKLRV